LYEGLVAIAELELLQII